MTLILAALLLFSPESAAEKAERLSAEALNRAQTGQSAEAQNLWREALTLDPGLFSANFNLAYSFISQGKHADAEPYLRSACKAKPDDFNSHYLLGSVLTQAGRREDALKAWRKALAIRPDHTKLMQIMIVEYGKGRYFGEASRLADLAVRITQPDPQLLSIAIKAYQDSDQHEAALSLALVYVETVPASGQANFETAFELNRAGRPSESIPYVQRAIELDPAYEEPYFLYGEILLRQGKAQQAAELLRKAIDRKPTYVAASIALARALAELGSIDEAIGQLVRTIDQDPTHPQPHLLLSQLYFRQGNEKAAAQAKQRSLELRRQRPEALESLASRVFEDK